MDWIGELMRRLKMLGHHDQLDRDLDDEIRLHLELREEQLVDRGVSAAEAPVPPACDLGTRLVCQRFQGAFSARGDCATQPAHVIRNRCLSADGSWKQESIIPLKRSL
jgi:hypothetical protein